MLKKLFFIVVIILSINSLLLAEGKEKEEKDVDKLIANAPGDFIDSGMRVFHQDIMFRYPKEWGVNPV